MHSQPFSGSRRLDRVIGETVTLLNVYQDMDAFKAENIHSHHSEAAFARQQDPPVQSLTGLGFQPGMTRRGCGGKPCRVLLAVVLSARVRRASGVQSEGRRLAPAFFAGWAGFWLSMPLWLDRGVAVVLLAFVVPIILLSQLSALLDRLGEQPAGWRARSAPRPALLPRLGELGALLRRGGAGLRRVAAAGAAAWLRWIAEMTFYHFPAECWSWSAICRTTTFTIVSATHDWMTAAYARQRDIEAGMHGGPPYTEVWGLGQAIDRMFRGLSLAPDQRANLQQTEAQRKHGLLKPLSTRVTAATTPPW